MASMNYVDSVMSKSTNTVVYGNLYLRLRTMSHTIYTAKFEQTIIINMYIYDGKVSHTHRRMC